MHEAAVAIYIIPAVLGGSGGGLGSGGDPVTAVFGSGTREYSA